MKRKIWLLLGLVGLLHTSLAAEPLMITHLKGSVVNGHGYAVKLLTKVDTGQTISLPQGAVVTLTSLKDGTRYTISGQSKAKVEEEGVALLSGGKSKIKKVDGRKTTGQKPKDISSSMGGQLLRNASPKPRIFSVGKLSEPVLHWQEFPDALRFEVTLIKDGEVVEQIETKELRAELPMEPDTPYEMKLVAIMEGEADPITDSVPEVRSEEIKAIVTLLGKDLPTTALSLAKDRESMLYANKKDSSDIAIVFSQLFAQGLYYDALQIVNYCKKHREGELESVRGHLMKTIYEAQK